MTAEEFRAIRKGAKMTIAATVDFLRVGNERTIRRWESGERQINGSSEILMEMLRDGRLAAPAAPKRANAAGKAVNG